nr:ubiquitin-specific protease 13 [Tanacetum cinerariifolium]
MFADLEQKKLSAKRCKNLWEQSTIYSVTPPKSNSSERQPGVLLHNTKNQNPLHSKHAPPPAKPSPHPRNPTLRSAKHAPPLANPKPKAPKLKSSDVTEFDQRDGSGSEEGDEDAIVKDEEYEEEEEEKVSEEEEEEDFNVKGNKRGRKGKGEVVMSKGKKIKVEDKEVREKKRKKDSEPSSSKDEKPLKKKTKGKGKGPNAKVNMKSFMEDIGFSAASYRWNIAYDLPERREDDEFVQLWLSQFASKKKKRIFATDTAEKLVHSTRVDFRFKVNFLMLFANVMGKADTMRAFVNLLVVRRIREDTNIAGVDWCDFIHRCLAISHEPNTVSGVYNGPLCFLIMIEEKLSSISKEKAKVETLLRDANKEFSNDDSVKQYKGFFKETVLLEEAKAQKAPQNVKPKPAAVKTNEAAEKPNPAKNVKKLAEKPKEPAEKAHKAPKNAKPKPAAVKTKEAAEKPKEPAEKAHKAPKNAKPKPAAVKTKEAAEKPMPYKNVKELAEKPKEPAGDDYQVVPAATVMKAEDREEFEVETFTKWIEGNIDWVGEDEIHAWPQVVEPVNMVQPSTPKRVFSSPSKEYVKPVKPVNSPYMCRRIDVIARCKRIEFVLGNSLFAMEGDK